MYLQVKECQRLPVNNEKLEEKYGTDPSSQTSEETNPDNTLILDSPASELW